MNSSDKAYVKPHEKNDALIWIQQFENLLAKDAIWLRRSKDYAIQNKINAPWMYSILNSVRWFEHYQSKKTYLKLKAIFDFSFILLWAVLLLPVFVLISICIKVESRGPIFFKQLRIGQFGLPFVIWKFRTMYEGAEAQRPPVDPMTKVYRDPRGTRVGSFLRKYKLDEFPQLFNVLNGNMALIGPRPLSIEETAIIKDEHFLRFSVKPGMSGLWQVRASNTNDPEVKLKLDAIYASECAFIYDIKLLVLTVPVMIRGEKFLPSPKIGNEKPLKKSA